MGMAYSVGTGGSGTYQVFLLEEKRFDERCNGYRCSDPVSNPLIAFLF